MGGHSPVMTHREAVRYRAPFFCLLVYSLLWCQPDQLSPHRTDSSSAYRVFEPAEKPDASVLHPLNPNS